MAFIELNQVKYSYTSADLKEIPAVNGVSLTVEEGGFIALVGRNGSGKSTLAKLLNGLLVPDSGSVLIDGMDTAQQKNLFNIRKEVGVVFQNPDNQTVATIIEDDIAFGPENLGLESAEIRRRVDWALKAVGMDGYQRGTPFRLSGGQKQRIAIAGVLAIKPRVIVLDESTAMLDPKGRAEVMEVVKRLRSEENVTIIMITHFMEEALECDRIIVMDDGRIVMDGDSRILHRAEELRQAGLDVPAAISVTERLKEHGMELEGNIISAETFADAVCAALKEESCR